MSIPNEPIVFISRSRVKPGKVEALRAFLRDGAQGLASSKPRTRAFLAYLDGDSTTLTIVHLFGDAESMAAHLEGVDQRSEVASEFIETVALDVYGNPPQPILDAMQRSSDAGVALSVLPIFVGGFLRPD